MTYALRTYRVTKSYQGNEVVSEVSMNIRRGEIYGFLGPNGAGKTTLMKMMTNLVKPTSGEIEILGQKLTDTSFELLGRMGSIIEYPIFYDKLTARENLDLHCEYMGYHDKKAIDEALELVNLRGIDKKMVKDFSLGMKQRLGIARAITTKPELLLLDEPINGLDPIGMKELRDLFRMLSRDYGITLLISSHMLGEIEQMADTIGVINHGKLLAEVAMAEVREQNAAYIEIVTTNSQHAVFVLENRMNLTNLRLMNEQVIRVYDTELPQNEIAKTLIMNDVIIESIHKKNQSLEDYFLTLLNGGGIHA
ncbi:ABC transporter ATP-binding protein [Paenibacillus thiaminolyticus]|uniref:ABC transporter ATP-binding protein n=1 Tax=Paenibacillus thiaminolyticus TaxID=49283 RepID=A0AAP9J1E6_PANTH|nr:ABC transporter ATP-binding protein [Paenibacillus thiaminolyticus]MCY9536282.1 ABC transporter ATP-binding protein [Paenibacillus thiaminolyticus]MCY9604325.1 ABC transporter ATP-binding protein [Paenibacillus thiaminolyticus]MCY9609577.1 ABC transporter ATP-binding protein [Paenibacillus thiaminolyticus]MCY9616031.1 ABC transporter ATP-binding protein [Paenibacillus thiaminolyticus]MCY9621450.1 ABC transporter ATP-binding protein [Paenibacillus thiaminolyticus]